MQKTGCSAVVATKTRMPEVKGTVEQALWESKSAGHISTASLESEDKIGPIEGSVGGWR